MKTLSGRYKDAGISTPLPIAIQYAKNYAEEPGNSATDQPENTYKIQVMGNYFSQQPNTEVPEDETQTALEVLEQSLPAEQAPYLSTLNIMSENPVYTHYLPCYELNDQASSSTQAGE